VDGIDINRGARNNIPDEASFEGTQQIVDLVQSIDYDDLVIVLITGGGSALFSYPLHPITIEEKGALVKTL
jgi:glycerate-2-kinase